MLLDGGNGNDNRCIFRKRRNARPTQLMQQHAVYLARWEVQAWGGGCVGGRKLPRNSLAKFHRGVRAGEFDFGRAEQDRHQARPVLHSDELAKSQ